MNRFWRLRCLHDHIEVYFLPSPVQGTGLGQYVAFLSVCLSVCPKPLFSSSSSLHWTIILLLYMQVNLFSSNLSNPRSGGGISSDLCRSNSLGTFHSRVGRDDSSSSSTVWVFYTGMRWLLLLLHCTAVVFYTGTKWLLLLHSSLSLSLSLQMGGGKIFLLLSILW